MTRAWLLLVLCACEPVSGLVLGRDVKRCREAQTPVVRPLFAPAEAVTPPPVSVRADGVIVTTIAGRVRGRHEREGRYATYDTRYFENRSYVITIEDAVATGTSSVTVTFEPATDVSSNGPGTNFRHWKIYGAAGNTGGGYTFAVNVGMTRLTPRRLVQTVTENARAQRPLQRGDVLDFELGIYLQGADPADPNPIPGGSAYFSDTFRYQVGIGGLTPENFDDFAQLGPALEQRLGGATTTVANALADGTIVEPDFAYAQLALNTQPPHAQQFLEGRRFFHTHPDTGLNVENGNPPLAALPGARSEACLDCHARGLAGLGLLEAVDEQTVLALSDENDCDGDGISGRPSLVGGRLGRFGTVAQHASLAERIAVEAPGLDAGALERLETFVRLLGMAPQRPGTSGAAFEAMGCTHCHVATLTTGDTHPFAELRGQTIHPYTDLLLHDLGAGERRTAPLWGRGGGDFSAHHGEAQAALDAFNASSAAEQQAVRDFLSSL